MSKPNTLKIDEIEYVRKDSIDKPAQELDGMKYVICRTYSAGVFAGYLESKDGQEVVLRNSRRLWYWDGAASLSQLAVEGVKKPENCKFPRVVSRTELMQAIEILYCTENARINIQGVKIWEK